MTDLQDLTDLLTNNLSSPQPKSVTTPYISHLLTLPLSDLTSTEPTSLSTTSTNLTRSIQSLAKRSHRAISTAATSWEHLKSELPALVQHTNSLTNALPSLESKATAFAEKYRKSAESSNETLIARRNALLLARNADRITNILDLPTLLASAVTASTSPSTTATYASALDLHAHIRRLIALYPSSPLIVSLNVQAERQMALLTSSLITGLRAPGVKLAGAMRTIGWMRRIAPELDSKHEGDGLLGALWLSGRLHALLTMLDALEPLRELAEQERQTSIKLASPKKSRRRTNSTTKPPATVTGTQTERYLKRYIEIYREQSFAILSIHNSIFPNFLNSSTIPSPSATFTSHLIDMLFSTLRTHMPTIKDIPARESLMTQVLYCAGSLGRLGGDFSLMVGVLEEELAEETQLSDAAAAEADEWVRVIGRHRVQASRLELLASGVGTSRIREGGVS